MDPENGQSRDDANTWVVHFPMKSPDGAITRKDRSVTNSVTIGCTTKSIGRT